MKIFWLFNHPAPYKVDFFNELGKEVELKVIFERDIEGDRNALFYDRKAINYDETIANSKKYGDIDNYTKLPLEILKKEKFDLIVINGWRTKTERKVISYLKRHHMPYVFYINGGIKKNKENFFLRLAKRHYIKGADKYLAPNLESGDYLDFYGADRDKIFYYPYSTIYEKEVLRKPLSKLEKEEIKKKYGIEGEHCYCTCGQFIKRKNFEALIEVWKKAKEDQILYVIGEGPLENSYRNTIEEEKIENVKIIPFLEHSKLLELFSCFDLFLFPSNEDIYGHVINEAMSQGLPVISTKNANSALKLIVEGENGYFDSFTNPEETLSKVDKLLEEENQLAAIKTANENTLEVMTKIHMDLFKEWAKK